MNLSGLYGHTLHLNINDVYGQIDCCGIVWCAYSYANHRCQVMKFRDEFQGSLSMDGESNRATVSHATSPNSIRINAPMLLGKAGDFVADYF
ncbi:hypothetical protein P4S72_14780 [Vibrio sp. PP-XX7]